MTQTIQTQVALRMLATLLTFAMVVMCIGGPSPAQAATNDLEIAGWIPYWQDTMGTKSARDNIELIDTLHPFVFSVKSDGSLADLGDITDRKWSRLFNDAEDEGVEVIPTVMWSDGAATHAILSDADLREEHIEHIVEMVEDGDFAGVDIDYESKWAETKDYYSQFLEELRDELDNEYVLTCTVEPRIPPTSRYRAGEIPAVIEYANDYTAIAEHCDRIELMLYDQQRADLVINEARTGEPYMPVADADWVEKTLVYALESFPAEKVMLGIPTYGYHYTVTVAPNWYRGYTRIGALNMPDLLDIADEYDVEPSRHAGGEMTFTYFDEDSPFRLLESLPTPEGTRTGMEAAAKALLFANYTGMEVPVRLGWYGDAESFRDKLELADEYNLRGVAFFKIDGEEDEDIWDILED